MLTYSRIQEIKKFYNRSIIVFKNECFEYTMFILFDILSVIVNLLIDILLAPIELISIIIWFTVLRK